jgi:hypothetical protein
VAKLLLDPNVDVQIAACRVTEKVKAAALREPLARVHNTAREEWLLGAASNAAYDWLPRLQYIQTFVARLDEEEMSRVCLSHLTFILTGYSGSSGPGNLSKEEAKACKRAWEEFLRVHEKEVAEGRKFAISDPRVPLRELFPGITFHPSREK